MRKSQWYDVQSVRHFIFSRPESSTGIKSSSKKQLKKSTTNKEEPVAIVYNDMEDVVANDTFTSPTDVSVGDHVSVQWDDGQDYTGTVIKVLPWVRGADLDTDVDYQKRIDEATSSFASSSSVAVCVKYDDGDICWSNVEEEDGFIILERAKPKSTLDRTNTEESIEIEKTQQESGLDDSASRPLPVQQRHERRRKTLKKKLDRSNTEESIEIENTQQEPRLLYSVSRTSPRRKTWNLDRTRSKRKNEATSMQTMQRKRNKTM